jgi:transposase
VGHATRLPAGGTKRPEHKQAKVGGGQGHVRGAAGRHPQGSHAGRRAALPSDKCHADKAYDNRRCRGYLARRGIEVRIARRGVESSTRLGRHRWKAERSIAWLAGCRRLRIRYDRDSERFFAFAMLGCARLCYKRLPCAATAQLP